MLIQFIFLASLVLALIVTWRRAVQHVISWREALGWSVLWIAAGIVIVLPGTASFAASLLGIGRGADLVVYGSVVTLFFLVFKLFLTLDRLEQRLTDVVRKEALRGLPEKRHES